MLLSSQVKGEDMPEDDPQMSYMISAWARICKILGARFAPYLPLVMDPVMKTASMKPEVRVIISLNAGAGCTYYHRRDPHFKNKNQEYFFFVKYYSPG